MRIVQAVVLVAPPVLILWMGGTYLLDCGRLLLAPGVPVAFDWKSPEGPIRFWADGYRIDPDRRTASLWGLSAKRGNGVPIASVEGVEASGLDPFALRPDVRVRGVRAHLERDGRGFDLARLLPKKQGPPSTIPYSVTVLDARVTYVDRTFKTPLRQEVRTDRLAFDGIGDDWRAQGKVDLPGVGVTDVRAQSLPSVGTTVDLRSQALQLGRLATTLLPGLKARRLVAYGPVRLDLPSKGRVRIATTLRARAEGLVYGKYAVDAASLQGRASPEGFEGLIEARIGEIRGRFLGSATRKQGGGRVVASVPSPDALPGWARGYLPPKVGFRDASYEGWVAWSGTKPLVNGAVRAARAVYGTDAVENVRVRVAYSASTVDLRSLTAIWMGAPLAGDLSFDLRTKAVQGAALAPKVELAVLARRLGKTDLGLSGTVGGEALVSGTLEKPQVEGRLDGRLALKGQQLGDVDVRGAWLGGAARVDRLRLSGPLGAIVAGGTVRSDGTLALTAQARGIRIERLVPSAKGIVSANLSVGGTLRDPKAHGRVEAYRLAMADQTLPAAGLDFAADRQKIEMRRIAAVRGTARLRGRIDASLIGQGVVLSDPQTWLLGGRLALTGVQANEIPGVDGIGDLAGILSIPQADLSGRLGDPVLTAEMQGDGLIVRGIRMDSLRAEARVDKRGLKMTDLAAEGAGGRVAGTGVYDFAKRDGTVDLSVAELQLSRLLFDVSQDVTVTGTVSAPNVHLAIRDGKPFGTAEGTLSTVKVNDVLAGDGNWSLDATGERVKVVASVGRLDPTLRALDAEATYNVAEGSLAASVQAKDIPFQTLVAVVEARRASSESEAKRLDSIAGDLSGSVQVVRQKDGDLKIDATDLRAAAIRYSEVEYGTLTVAGVSRRGDRWTLNGGRLEGPAGTFALDGWVEENGPLNLQASGQGVRLSAFSPFAPALGQIVGDARFALAATGTTRSPRVTGSAGIDGLLAPNGPDAMSVSLDRIDVRDGSTSVAGVVRYGDRFGGLFTATAGWGFRDNILAAPLTAKVDVGTLVPLDPLDLSKGLRVDAVNLVDLPSLGAYIDPKRTVGGTLVGSFGATGVVGEPKVSGGIALRASQLGITIPGNAGRPLTRIDDDLRDVKGDLTFDERGAPKLDLSVGFERGGTLTAMGTLGDLQGVSFFKTLKERPDWRTWPVRGFVDMQDKNRITLRQNVAGGSTRVTVAGRMDVSGQAAAPFLDGKFYLSNLETSLPSFTEGTGESSAPILDPSFNLTILLADDNVPATSPVLPEPGRFKTATADLYLLGDATLKGSLSSPRLNADFLTDHGSIRLPGGVVRVDRGGQISVAYKPDSATGTGATASISIQGRSQITVNRQGLGTQRYDVTLDMNGDLLRENGIRFEATSDPSDLTQSEILNALGGTQYLQGISEGGSSTERNVRNALAGFALPGLLDTFTGGIGRALGLDYLSLEYNQYDQATVSFARSLPFGFSFQGRQQVGTPTPGYRSIYDLRLSYNLASLQRKGSSKLLNKLSRLTFSVGTDQDRPWKTSVEYGTRFGQRGGVEKPKHSLFPKGR